MFLLTWQKALTPRLIPVWIIESSIKGDLCRSPHSTVPQNRFGNEFRPYIEDELTKKEPHPDAKPMGVYSIRQSAEQVPGGITNKN
jgi:hypothetical protein